MKKLVSTLLAVTLIIGSSTSVFADSNLMYANTGYVYYCVGTGHNPSNPKIDTSAEASTVQKYIQKWGYDCGPYNFFKNGSAKEFSQGRLNSPIVYFAGHGNATTLDCGGSGITIESRYAPFVNINNFDFGEVQLAFLAGCNTSSTTNSIAKKFVTNGATYSIGWNSSPKTTHMKVFSKAYFQELDQGKSFEDAEKTAAKETQKVTGGQKTAAIFDFKSFGDKLAHLNILYSLYLSFTNDESSLKPSIETEETQYIVEESVIYSEYTNDYSALAEYMKKNIAENFNIDDYSISETGGTSLNWILLNYKVGDIASDFGYEIRVENNQVVLIADFGNNITNQNIKIDASTLLDDETLCKMALEELGNPKNVDEQIVYYYFDSSLYKVRYIVDTVIGSDEYGFSCIGFEYVQ